MINELSSCLFMRWPTASTRFSLFQPWFRKASSIHRGKNDIEFFQYLLYVSHVLSTTPSDPPYKNFSKIFLVIFIRK